MFAIADQEKEFNRALRNERRQGEIKGEIRGKIDVYHNEMNLSPDEIKKEL